MSNFVLLLVGTWPGLCVTADPLPRDSFALIVPGPIRPAMTNAVIKNARHPRPTMVIDLSSDESVRERKSLTESRIAWLVQQLSFAKERTRTSAAMVQVRAKFQTLKSVKARCLEKTLKIDEKDRSAHP